jgi:hypothetical protein
MLPGNLQKLDIGNSGLARGQREIACGRNKVGRLSADGVGAWNQSFEAELALIAGSHLCNVVLAGASVNQQMDGNTGDRLALEVYHAAGDFEVLREEQS